jgi:hypothetical protein
MASASLPLSRTMAIAPRPGAVAQATIVSSALFGIHQFTSTASSQRLRGAWRATQDYTFLGKDIAPRSCLRGAHSALKKLQQQSSVALCAASRPL